MFNLLFNLFLSRKFLFSFQLPGESQKIDKIITVFAYQYAQQNPSAFHTGRKIFLLLLNERGSICLCFCRFTEDAYVLAYAAILLNTTLHNSNAKNQHLSLADEKTFVETMLDFDKDTNLSEEIIRVS